MMGGLHATFEQLASLIARLDADDIRKLQPSEEAQRRFEALVQKSKDKTISEDEQEELRQFFVLERLMRMVKIKAAG